MFIRIKSARGNLKVTQLLFVPLDLFFQEASKVKQFGWQRTEYPHQFTLF